MKKIPYKFVDGTVSEVEVSDELYAIHDEMVAEEKRNHWKNTRRHISLSYLNEHEIDIPDESGTPLDKLVEQEDENEFYKWLKSFLKPKQVESLNLVFDGLSQTEIAKLKGVSQQAISKQLKNILEKIKFFSEKGCDLPSLVLIGGGNKSAYYILRGLRK